MPSNPGVAEMEEASPTERAPLLRELAGAFEQEAETVRALREELLRQRAGVAANDVAAVGASADAIGRIILTLQEARRRRVALLADLTGDGALPIDRLEEALKAPLPPALDRSRRLLRQSARDASREAAINHHVLRHAVDAGEAFLQALFSSAAEPAPVYRSPERPSDPGVAPGVIVNRKA
jgi:hypothetical protein